MQASDTFVTHSRANYYFLLSADTPETSELNLLSFMHRRHRSRADNEVRARTRKRARTHVRMYRHTSLLHGPPSAEIARSIFL